MIKPTTVGRYYRGMVLGPDDVYVGRPTKWGNPWNLKKEEDRPMVIQLFEDWASERITKPMVTAKGLEQLKAPFTVVDIKRELRGKRLLCWCHPKACHADVLARMADSPDAIVDTRAVAKLDLK